ncbi:TPA: lipase family protein [Vibrio vulnificus]|nr:lipase family protein [Vibrio vulnificus]
MKTLSPKDALTFAEQAYDIEFETSTFRPERRLAKKFNFDAGKTTVKAKTGSPLGLLSNRISNFVLCAQGHGSMDGQYVFAFRGTNFDFTADKLTDINIGVKGSSNGAYAHAGFVNTFNSIKASLAHYIQANLNNIKTIHCVGHSLGGAIASLCADWVKEKYKISVVLYTFGAPRIGLFSYAQKSSSSNLCIFRCTNGADPVPMVPLWPFTHAPTNSPEYRLDNSFGIKPEAHKLASSIGYKKALTSDSWQHIKRFSCENIYKSTRLKLQNSHKVIFNNYWADKIASAIRTLLRDAGYVALLSFQNMAMSGLTFYDLIAQAIEKIANISQRFREQTEGLLGHMLKFAGKIVHKLTDLSSRFIKNVFGSVLKRLKSSVFNAIK